MSDPVPFPPLDARCPPPCDCWLEWERQVNAWVEAVARVVRWDGTQDDLGRWLRTFNWFPTPSHPWFRWHEIVGSAIDHGWTLHSLPPGASS